jgi:acyl-CoA thioesterase-1
MISSTRVFIRIVFLGAILLSGPAYAQSSRIVALGDSNTAGFGVGSQQAFPAHLEALLRATGNDAQVVNAGVSSDTTYGMLSRLDAAAPPGTQAVIVQGGYNDRLRGSPPTAIIANIEAILARLSARQIRGVVCGFFDPGWDAVGDAVARKYGAVFVPGGACYDSTYRGPDGLHMNATGHQVIATRLLPVMQRLLAPARRGGVEVQAAQPALGAGSSFVSYSPRRRSSPMLLASSKRPVAHVRTARPRAQ